MSVHRASHATSIPRRRHRIWPWVVLILALLVVLLGVSGFFGLKLYSEAKQVKVHEEQAMQLLDGVTDLGNLDNLDTVRQQISQAKTETAAANEIAHGTLWNIASKAPVYGDDITTVQGMTSVVDSLVSDSVPQFMNVLSTLKSAQLSSGDGQLNLQPILEAQKNIATANQSLQQQVQKYQQLPKAHIGMVKNAYATGNTQLTKMADKVNQLSGTFQILPDFLGSDQPRTYALMAMTTSEERSSGGLIGSVGVVTTDNGKISIGDFRPQKPDTMLAFVGDGPDRPDVQQHAQALGISDHILFLGQRTDVNHLYQAFDAFCLPSRYEGLGMVAIEAQVAGCPCVLSDQVPHEADISGKTSFISLENKSSWISTVLNISSQTANRQIETSNTCAEKYDISASANRLTFLYVSSAESANGWEETL